MENEFKYPIKAVSKLTGLTVHVIRAWEKRYNATLPSRTDTNRRLYSDNDVEKLKLLAHLTAKGFNIGNIASLSINELSELTESKENSQPDKRYNLEDNDDPSHYLNLSIEAVIEFDARSLEQFIYNASVKLDTFTFLEKFVAPLATQAGHDWETGEIRVYQEHLLTAQLRTFLLNMLQNSQPNETSHNLLVATPSEQIHEIGALIVSIIAATCGWEVTYLGNNLPTDEIIAAADRLNSKAIAMSLVYPEDDINLKRDLIKLNQLQTKDIHIFVGGRASWSYKDLFDKIGVQIINDLTELKESLIKIKKEDF